MIEAPNLVWGAKDWAAISACVVGVLLVLLILGYRGVGASRVVRWAAGTLKILAIALLALCLLEPYFQGNRAKPGANQFVVLVDNSQSMTLKDAGASTSRGDSFKSLATKDAPWLSSIARDFDLRQFAFDSQLRGIENPDALTFDGHSSDLGNSLEKILARYQGRPLAGIMVFTDGSATDPQAVERVLAKARAQAGKDSIVPPIFPVLMGREAPAKDISIDHVTVTQTNFEDAPVTLAAQISTAGMKGKTIVAELFDDKGKKAEGVEDQHQTVEKDGEPILIRFQLKPPEPPAATQPGTSVEAATKPFEQTDGISFYQVRVSEDGKQTQFEHPAQTDEATLANNTRLAVVDRGKGPYRVLYVSGRPNWEYKFMHRAVSTDDQVQITALMRVAKREPRFNFIGHTGETVNPLFSGFDNTNPDDPQQYDQPVIERLGVNDQNELNAGFPKTPDDLFGYHAIILDDIEASFFTQDQMQLIKNFVRDRGGTLMMLGGPDTFKNGKYEKTDVGDMLPVYIDQSPTYPADIQFNLALTREGWLEPWLRLRSDEDSENARLNAMQASPFHVLSPVQGIKPGATILTRAVDPAGVTVPALVEQRFGKGHVAALMIGDMWSWEMHRASNTDNDFEKAWRQVFRWMVSDVPQPIEVNLKTVHDPGQHDAAGDALSDATGTSAGGDAVRIVVQVRNKNYEPLDNAKVMVKVTGPDNKEVSIPASPTGNEPGQYQAVHMPRQPGAYHATVDVKAMDDKVIGIAHAGWTSDPAAEEFRQLQPDATLLERIAKTTGGEMVDAARLDAFASSLPLRKVPIMEPYVQPFWHQSWVFMLAIGLLVAEWTLRRWKGLP